MAAPELTPADRIRELNDINGGISDMLKHMAQAINALSPNSQPGGNGVEARKEVFEQQSRAAYVAIQAFNATMKRQAYALEEAGIITPDPYAAGSEGLSKAQQQMQAQNRGNNNAPKIPPTQQLNPERIKNGGLGNFDVGWLNSRGNKVGAEKEAELIQEAKELLAKAMNSGDSIV